MSRSLCRMIYFLVSHSSLEVMLLATLANGNSNGFEAYAADTCDAISTCTNFQTGTGK